MGRKDRKIALLVDVDNVKIGKDAMDELLNELNENGEVVYCKFYGYNDRKHLYLTDFINNFGHETAPFMRLKKRYSQLDNRILIDAVRINYTKPEINTFCIVAGDGDLIPLLVELKSCGKTCIDVNTEYQELNAHMFDEHIYLRYIDGAVETYTPKTKKKPTKRSTVRMAPPAPAKKAPAKKPAPVIRPAPQPVVEEYEEEYDYDYEPAPAPQPVRRPAPAPQPAYVAPARRPAPQPAPVEEDFDNYIEDEVYDEPVSREEDLSDILKSITSRYNQLDFTNDDNMSEKLRLIRDIENLIDRENSKGEGIYSANEDIRQIFNDLQDVVDDMKNAL